ncbi:Phage lysozyme [uncultured archaeon]|nr:Phage lysozyme [uncultured archaeon]
MQYSKSGLQLTESFEGCKLVAYQDSVGRWTIGFGHTAGVQPGDTCTLEQAEAMLAADTAWAQAFVNHIVKMQLTQGEFDALVDFTFNLGSGNFSHSTLLTLVNQGNFSAAANEFQKWDKAGGVVVAGLLRRRVAEQNEFNS